EAVQSLQRNLTITPVKGSNIILLTFRHGNAETARRVLEEMVNRYPDMHRDAHNPRDGFDVVTTQANRAKGDLERTEEALKKLKSNEEIISLPESIAALNEEVAQSLKELRSAETELAQQGALVKEMERWLTDGSSTTEKTAEAPRDAFLQY